MPTALRVSSLIHVHFPFAWCHSNRNKTNHVPLSALLPSYQPCQTCRALPALIIWLHAPFQPGNNRIQIMPGGSQGHSLSQVSHSLSIATRGIPMANELLSPAEKPNPVHSIKLMVGEGRGGGASLQETGDICLTHTALE